MLSIRSRPAVWMYASTLFVSIAFDFNVYVASLVHVYVHDVAALLIGLLGVVLAVRHRSLIGGSRRLLIPLGVLAFVVANTILIGALHYGGIPADMRKLFWLEHGDALRIVGELFVAVWTFGQLGANREIGWFTLDVAAWGAAIAVAWTVAISIALNTPHTTTTTLDLDVLIGLPLAVLFVVEKWPPRAADVIRLVLLGAGSTFLFSRATMLTIAFTAIAVLVAARSIRKAGVAIASIVAGWTLVIASSLLLYGSASLVAETLLRLESIGNPQLAPYTIPNRAAIWRDALRISTISPIVGVGYHDYFAYSRVTEIKLNSPPEPNDLFSSRIKSAHNDYLSWLSEMGIVGLTVLVGFYAVALATGVRRWRREADRRLPHAYTIALITAFLGISVFGEVLIPRSPDAVALAMVWWLLFATLFGDDPGGAGAHLPPKLM